jgi:hypothetical protein
MATVELKSGNRSRKSILRPRNVDGTWLPPNPLNWLVLKPDQDGSAPVLSKVLYRLKGGKIVPAPSNGQDVREMSNLVLLDDTDWQMQ